MVQGLEGQGIKMNVQHRTPNIEHRMKKNIENLATSIDWDFRFAPTRIVDELLLFRAKDRRKVVLSRAMRLLLWFNTGVYFSLNQIQNSTLDVRCSTFICNLVLSQ